VEGLDAPGELDGAREQIVLAFELRRDGLSAIADNIGAAQSNEVDQRREALATITDHMGDFLASDVLYRRASEDIDAVLQEEGISQKVPESQFLPDTSWLEETTVAENLAGITGAEGEVTGLHGLGIAAVLVNGAEVTPDAQNTVTADGAAEVEVSVDNQGDSEETDIPVQVTVTGGDEPIEAEETLSKILPGETQTVTVPLDPAPSKGDEVTIEVFVEPVLGEQVADNNEATYEATFE
jgi:hypothetical protein